MANEHVHPLMAGILNKQCGVRQYRCWFDYHGVRVSQVVDCWPGEEEDKSRALLAAKHDMPAGRLKFIGTEVIV